MRRLVRLFYLLIPVLLLAYACEDPAGEEHEKDLSIAEVRELYDELVSDRPSGGRQDDVGINWDNGRYKDISVGDALVFPLENVTSQYISNTEDGILYPVQQHAYAFAYKDSEESVLLEYVQTVPTANTEAFTGFVTIADWQGDLKYAIYYEDGMVVNPNSDGRTEGCTQTFYFDCTDVSVNGEVVYTSCTQTGSSIDCTLDWPTLEPEAYDNNGGGNGEDDGINLCPHPDLEGQYIECPDNMVICEEGFVANANGDCVRELCEAGTTFHPEFGCVSEEDLWEEESIDDSELEPCMQNILTGLKSIEEGVGRMIQKFDGDAPGFNWTVKSGEVSNGNAKTSTEFNDGVTTTFDSQKFGNASRLSIARTFYHESVHAYIVAVESTTGPVDQRRELLGVNWFDVLGDIRENQGHKFIAEQFMNEIATSLKAYGTSLGYDLTDQFYQDLAWGGLSDYDPDGDKVTEETPWFIEMVPDAAERARIKDVIAVEQNGFKLDGTRSIQKGGNGGC